MSLRIPRPVVRIKVCCIESPEEAALAVSRGASALGLVSRMPSGPGVISEELIAEIAEGIPPPVASFLLTSLTDVHSIQDQRRRCRVNTVQICDRLGAGMHQELRSAMPGVKIVQVVHVGGEESIEEARAVAPHVDAILLDSGRPAQTVRELGGTGRTHDWQVSRRIRETVGVPVFLAGGLRPENVGEAIRLVRPFAVDVCSGVRTEARLDPYKLQDFFDAVQVALTRA